MDQDFFAEYAVIEDTHWWFRGRRKIFEQVLAQLAAPHERMRILDIGFGTGAMLTFLERFGTVLGMDMSAEAVRFARTRCDRPMLLGDITRIPLPDGALDLVTACDIVEHVDDEEGAFAELARVCKPGGHMLVTVPAFQFLWGNQDVVSHHRRRYRLGPLQRSIENAGFRIVILSYFNSLLFPIVAAIRVVRRLRGEAYDGEVPKSDFTMTKPGPLNDILTHVFGAEGRLLTRWRLPVGVSLLCLAERT